MATKKLDFEQSMARLEEIVALLEKGEAPLEQSLALFEEGTKLMANCSALLDKAEQQVSLLKVGAEGQPEEVPFDTEE
ncbi:MAG: exodeoxyribonuclease VII small subunit [Oscillospiraceae bacterium]|nr:exodeoxyribonuclease VII small subunit [Oscillospiraceae bacterium]